MGWDEDTPWPYSRYSNRNAGSGRASRFENPPVVLGESVENDDTETKGAEENSVSDEDGGNMTTNSRATPRSKWAQWAGWAITGLMVMFLLADALTKLVLEPHVVEATTKIGYPLDAIRPLGIICLVCTILYAIPRTAILGAILLTGFLGGAIASKVRIEDPLFSSVLFCLYFGLLVWGGLYLRDDRLRALLPWRR
jgi:hypothetical protein